MKRHDGGCGGQASGSDFEGQTKTKLASADATKAVFSVTGGRAAALF